MAIETINNVGGIAALDGARLEAVLGDSRSDPSTGAAEVARLVEGGVAAIIGGYASAITNATTDEAAKSGTPHVIDVGLSDQLMTKTQRNTFRFGPGYSVLSLASVDMLAAINNAAGKPLESVLIVHEESIFGSGTAALFQRELPNKGFKIVETIKHANPTTNFANIVREIGRRKPDLVIPASYYNEYVALALELYRQKVRPKAVYSLLGGAPSSLKFVGDHNKEAQFLLDSGHWYNPKSPAARARRRIAERRGVAYTYEVFLTYNAVAFLVDGIERAGTIDKRKLVRTLAESKWAGHGMPYAPTKMVAGQNLGARAACTQVIGKTIELVHPGDFASADPIIPIPS